MSAKSQIKKVVLAYSGGLDTSIILKWLQTEYGAEVVTFTDDLGQGEEIEPARAKALAAGVKPESARTRIRVQSTVTPKTSSRWSNSSLLLNWTSNRPFPPL